MIITSKDELFKTVIMEDDLVMTKVELTIFNTSRVGKNIKRSKEVNQLREVKRYIWGECKKKAKELKRADTCKETKVKA